MSKRAMLWMVALVAFGFTYAAAVNIKAVSVSSVPTFGGGTQTSVRTSCEGMWNPSEWFARWCSESLPPRIGVLAIGVVVLLVCGYFAEKGRTPTAQPSASGRAHLVTYDAMTKLYSCDEAGCEFESFSGRAVGDHRRETRQTRTIASVTEPDTSGFQLPRSTHSNGASPSVPASVMPTSVTEPQREYKTCPDCAEEVRAAARKCRFCGYMFDAAPVVGDVH